MSMRIKRIV